MSEAEKKDTTPTPAVVPLSVDIVDPTEGSLKAGEEGHQEVGFASFWLVEQLVEFKYLK